MIEGDSKNDSIDWKELDDSHNKLIELLKELDYVACVIDVNYNMVKDNYTSCKFNITEDNEKDKEEFRIAKGIFKRTLDRENNSHRNEIKEASKVLRYVLNSLADNPKNKLRIITLEVLWEVLLAKLEMASCNQGLTQLKCLNEQVEVLNTELVNAREEIRMLKTKIDKLNRKSEESLIRYNSETHFLKNEVQSLKAINEANEGQIEQLLNPYRFIYVHYFLKRFDHKLSKNRVHELESLISILQALKNKENHQDEVNDSIKGTFFVEKFKLPPSLILVLRKLEEILEIDSRVITNRLKCVQDELKELNEGMKNKVIFKNEGINTDPLKELSYKIKITKKSEWRKAILNYDVNVTTSLSSLTALSTLEKYIEQKLRLDIEDSINSQIGFSNFVFEQYVTKYGLRSAASDALLSLYHVNA